MCGSEAAAATALSEGSCEDCAVELDMMNSCVLRIQSWDAAGMSSEESRKNAGVLDDFAKLLNPQRNTKAYALCQGTAVEHGCIALLLTLSKDAVSDGMRSKSLEVLARLAFSNAPVANSIAAHDLFLPVLSRSLQVTSVTEQLSALQLAQAVVASSGLAIADMAPAVVELVVQLLRENSFQAIPMMAFETLVSCSFHCPSVVAVALPWSTLADLVAENRQRPTWLAQDTLAEFSGGVLAANLMKEAAPVSDGESIAHESVNAFLAGPFVGYLCEALSAAAERREWPEQTSAFHSPARLSLTVRALAERGYRKLLLGAVYPLACAVENDHGAGSREPLAALLELCKNMDCLESLLAMVTFREGKLEALRETDDTAEALAAFLNLVGSIFANAQAVLNESAVYCKHAPGVSELAHAFNAVAVIDNYIDLDQLRQVLKLVPIGPFALARERLRADVDSRRFGFLDVVEHLYGTPSIWGWWPSMMEDTAAMMAECSAKLSLVVLVELFESGAGEGTTVCEESLRSQVLPAAHILETEGEAIDQSFSDLYGQPPLEFQQFVQWMITLTLRLADERAAMTPEPDC